MRISDWSSDVCSSDLVVGVLVGIVWGAFDFGIPAPVGRFLDLLAGAAAPAALFSLGASLVEFRIRGALRQSLSVVALKLVVNPLLVWLLAAFDLRLPTPWCDIAVLCGAFPLGANVFHLA